MHVLPHARTSAGQRSIIARSTRTTRLDLGTLLHQWSRGVLAHAVAEDLLGTDGPVTQRRLAVLVFRTQTPRLPFDGGSHGGGAGFFVRRHTLVSWEVKQLKQIEH